MEKPHAIVSARLAQYQLKSLRPQLRDLNYTAPQVWGSANGRMREKPSPNIFDICHKMFALLGRIRHRTHYKKQPQHKTTRHDAEGRTEATEREETAEKVQKRKRKETERRG